MGLLFTISHSMHFISCSALLSPSCIQIFLIFFLFNIFITKANNGCLQKIETSWQNQQNDICAQGRLRSAWASAQSDRVFAVPIKKHWIFSYPSSALRSLWSDWADDQADQSLCRVHRSFSWFCHEAAQMHNDWHQQDQMLFYQELRWRNEIIIN